MPRRKIPYERIDPELRELVRLLNKVKGMMTVDSCFGHPGKIWNHDSEAFIGVFITDRKLFNEFWTAFFEKFDGKVTTGLNTGDVQFCMHKHCFQWWAQPKERVFTIHGWHDPSTRKGREEKLIAIKMACEFIKQYNKKVRSRTKKQ